MSIPFTQYKMPNGRHVEVCIERPAEIEDKARELIARGYHFEIEMLSTGEIAGYIVYPNGKNISTFICANGPAVPKEIDRMILEFPSHQPSNPPP